MPNPQPGAATSFATKAVYLLFGAVVLVFVYFAAMGLAKRRRGAIPDQVGRLKV